MLPRPLVIYHLCWIYEELGVLTILERGYGKVLVGMDQHIMSQVCI